MNPKSEVVRVGKRFAVVIPKSVRESVGLKEGQQLEVKVEGRSIVLTPRPDPFKRLGELLSGIRYDEEAEREAERWLLSG